MAAEAPRAWQRMLSGRRLDLLDPSPLDIEIEDIAHGLARVARWNGQTVGEHIFSVAQHSLLVEAFGAELEPELPAASRLTVLLHDAAEYVLGDVISPFKAVIGDGYTAVEARLSSAIYLRFGLPAEPSASVKRIMKRSDRLAAFHEATACGLRARGGFEVLRPTRREILQRSMNTSHRGQSAPRSGTTLIGSNFCPNAQVGSPP